MACYDLQLERLMPLVEQWLEMWPQNALYTAAHWGADQELDACCLLLDDRHDRHRRRVALYGAYSGVTLRAARRPKPPSLKQQALASVERFEKNGEFFSDQMRELDIIRRALEALPDD